MENSRRVEGVEVGSPFFLISSPLCSHILIFCSLIIKVDPKEAFSSIRPTLSLSSSMNLDRF